MRARSMTIHSLPTRSCPAQARKALIAAPPACPFTGAVASFHRAQQGKDCIAGAAFRQVGRVTHACDFDQTYLR